MIATEVVYTVVCPHCEQDTKSRVNHLLTAGPSIAWEWYCDLCGGKYHIKQAAVGVEGLLVTKLPGCKINIVCYLKHGDMCIAYKDYFPLSDRGQSIDWAAEFAHKQYFYEEHTCPSNVIGSPVIEISTGDPDPHEILTLLAIGPWREDMNALNYEWVIPTIPYPKEN